MSNELGLKEEQLKQAVLKKEAMERLMSNKDFELVYGEKALNEEIVRCTSHLQIPEAREEMMQILYALSYLKIDRYRIIQLGEMASKQLEDSKEEQQLQ